MSSEADAAGPPRRWYRELHWQILLAMGLALALSVPLRALGWHESPALLGGVAFVGELFLRLLRFLIVPLVLATIVVGISSLKPASLGRMGGMTVGFYALTSALAVLTGLLAVNLIQPGRGVSVEAAARPSVDPVPLTQVFLDIIPNNPFAALSETFDLPSVIFFAVLLGLGISVIGEPAQPLRSVFDALNRVMMKITDWVMAIAPWGIFALLLEVLLETGPEVLLNLFAYVATVLGALLVHGFITLPILLLLLARVSPRHAFRAMAPALLTAFSTASSAATLPVTMDCAEKRGGVPRTVTGFVLPIGATINMDGTALYQGVAALFVAQAFGVDLGLGQQIIIFLMASLAAIGAAGVPSAGLVTMVIVFEAVGIPLEGIGLIVAVDRILDMTRTAVNVWGDSCTSFFIAHRGGALDRERLGGAPAAD